MNASKTDTLRTRVRTLQCSSSYCTLLTFPECVEILVDLTGTKSVIVALLKILFIYRQSTGTMLVSRKSTLPNTAMTLRPGMHTRTPLVPLPFLSTTIHLM